MSDTVPITAGQVPEPPADRDDPGVLEDRLGSRREVLWWALIVAMALVDAVGFWLVLGDVIPERRDLLGLLVVGSALASVVLPHQMGAILRSRRDGFAGSLAVVAFSGAVWFALGVVMVVVRLNAEVGVVQQQRGTGGLADAPEVAAISGPLISAIMLACLYLATGVVAGRHAWESGGRTNVEERQLSAELRRATRQLRREQYEQEVARQRREQAQRGLEEVRARRDLHAELNDAVNDRIAQEVRVGIMYETGDPAATDALVRTELPARPGRRGDGDDRG